MGLDSSPPKTGGSDDPILCDLDGEREQVVSWESFVAQFHLPKRGGQVNGEGERVGQQRAGVGVDGQRPNRSRTKASKTPWDSPANPPSSSTNRVKWAVQESNESSEAEMPSALRIERKRRMEAKAVDKFNVNPRDGINYLVQKGVVQYTAESICQFLTSASGLSKRRLGEYFGMDNPMSQQVLSLFLNELALKGLELDDALRKVVRAFRMPGDTRKVDSPFSGGYFRVMERFSEKYHEENPEAFSSSGTVYVLSLSVMMANKEIYGEGGKDSRKMTEAQFVKINKGIDREREVPEDLLRRIYKRLQAAEISMDEGDLFESQIITFVAPTKRGWLRKKGTGYVNKWKRHWFVLNIGVLYYFISPEHQDAGPRCIIPLEYIEVEAVGTTELSLMKKTGGLVKSVKKMGHGVLEQGQHRSFQLRAESEADRNAWLESLRAEVLNISKCPALSVYANEPASGAPTPNSMRSLSGTSANSSIAAQFGSPSRRGRRGNKLARPRRFPPLSEGLSTSEIFPPPLLEGWARTSNGTHEWGRRYLALLSMGDPNMESAIYFFGDEWMCRRMVKIGVHTYHGYEYLREVSRVQLQQGEGYEGGGGDGDRQIVLELSKSLGRKLVIIPEEQRDFDLWVAQILAHCPNGAHGVPVTEGSPGPGWSVSNPIDRRDRSVPRSRTPSGRPSPIRGAIADGNGRMIISYDRSF